MEFGSAFPAEGETPELVEQGEGLFKIMTIATVAAGVVLSTTTTAQAGTNAPYVFTKSEANGIPAGQGAFFHDGDRFWIGARFWIEDTARDGHSAVLDVDVYTPDGDHYRLLCR